MCTSTGSTTLPVRRVQVGNTMAEVNAAQSLKTDEEQAPEIYRDTKLMAAPNSGDGQSGGNRAYNSSRPRYSHAGAGRTGARSYGGPARGNQQPVDQEVRKVQKLKKLIIFAGESNSQEMTILDRSAVCNIVDLDQEIEMSIVPPMAKDPSKKLNGYTRLENVAKNKNAVLETICEVAVNMGAKSSMLALLLAIWTHGHHGRWSTLKAPVPGGEGLIKADDQEDVVIKGGDAAMEDVDDEPVKSQGPEEAELIKLDDGGDEEMKEEVKSEGTSSALDWQISHSRFYLSVVKQTIGRVHKTLESLFSGALDLPWPVSETMIINGLRFLMDLVNVHVVEFASMVNWLNALIDVAGVMIDKKSEEVNVGAAGSILLNIVVSTINEASDKVIQSNHESFFSLGARIESMVNSLGLPRSISMLSSANPLYSDDVTLESMSELLNNWNVCQDTIANSGQVNRCRLAFYDYPVVREDPNLGRILIPHDSFKPIQLLPIITDELKNLFWRPLIPNPTSQEDSFRRRLQVSPRYNVSLVGPARLKELLPRVIHFTPSERITVERYVRDTLVTYRDDANEAARAVLSLPMIHDSMTMVMVNVIMQDVLRMPQPVDSMSYYLKVLYAMMALEPAVAKNVEIAVTTSAANLQDLGTSLTTLERFYGAWWSYLSSDPEDDGQWKEASGDSLGKMDAFIQHRGGFINMKYWFQQSAESLECIKGTKKAEDMDELIDEKQSESKYETKAAIESGVVVMRNQTPLVANFLRKSVEQFTLCVSGTTAKTRLIGMLRDWIPVGDHSPVMEYLPVKSNLLSLLATSHQVVKDELKAERDEGEMKIEEEGDAVIHLSCALLDDIIEGLRLKDLETVEDAVQPRVELARLLRTVDAVGAAVSTIKMEGADDTTIDVDDVVKIEAIDPTVEDQEPLTNLLFSDKAFSLIVISFLIRGQRTPTHFARVVKLYGPLLYPFLNEESNPKDAVSCRSALVVETIRFWQTSPVRLVSDIRTLIRSELVTLEDVIHVICLGVQKPFDSLSGVQRLDTSLQEVCIAYLPGMTLMPNGFLHNQLYDFVVSETEKKIYRRSDGEEVDGEVAKQQSVRVLDALVNYIVTFAIRGRSLGVDIKPSDNVDLQLHVQRATLTALQLVEHFSILIQSEPQFQQRLSDVVISVAQNTWNNLLGPNEMQQATEAFFREIIISRPL
eukprot:GHVH01008758.1.p1 GENE.GHVH01008758.1~~GHVH01008758.1.p1  ORF type:complete len:1195 (+),score=240.91 GHVH01008758.1:25-3585(+)